jgi:hypothetical protein
MGGHYRVRPSAATDLLDSAPCLAGLQPSPAQSGRAVTALLGPDNRAVPEIVEDVASYAGGASQPVFQALARSVQACSSLSFSPSGTRVAVRLAPSDIAPVGDADQAWTGSFSDAGSTFTFQIGMVLDGPEVVTLMWVDTVPGSDPVMGSFTSTLSLAIGKLA